MERGFYVFLLVLGAAFLAEGTKYAFWSRTAPGPGMFPTLASVALVCVSILSLVRTFIPQDGYPREASEFWPGKTALRKQAYGLGALIFYALTIGPLGFVLSTFVFLCIFLAALEAKHRLRSIAWAFLISAAAYILLVVLLKMPLPRGIIG